MRDGVLLGVEPCFRGRSVLAPIQGKDEDAEINALDNHIVEVSATQAAWRCTTFPNPSTLHAQTNAVILEVAGDTRTVLDLRLNTVQVSLSLGDLLEGGRGYHVQPYNSEAFLVHRAIAANDYAREFHWEDRDAQGACDVYDVEVRQVNGQCAWVSPMYVLS